MVWMKSVPICTFLAFWELFCVQLTSTSIRVEGKYGFYIQNYSPGEVIELSFLWC